MHRELERYIRPSASNQWVNCPASPRINLVASKLYPEIEQEYSSEGTVAHKILQEVIECNTPLPESHIALEPAVNLIREYARRGADVRCEVPIQYTIGDYVIRGTADVVIIATGGITVLDLKWGSIGISPVDNYQLLLYGLGLLQIYSDHRLRVGIIQPNGPGITISSEIPEYALATYRETIRDAVSRATGIEATYNTGDHCLWCRGREGICPAYNKILIDAIALGSDPELPDTTDWVLRSLQPIRKYLNKVEVTVKARLSRGEEIPGWKLEKEPGNTRWNEEVDIPLEMVKLIGGDRDDYLVERPITITEARKLLSQEQLTDLTYRPEITKIRRSNVAS